MYCFPLAISHLLVQGDVALSKKRNAMRCWSTYCKWKKSYNGLVEVPYTLSDYYCKAWAILSSESLNCGRKMSTQSNQYTVDMGRICQFNPRNQCYPNNINCVVITVDDEKSQIKRAMETFHKKTCIRFVPHSGQTDFLSIESELGWV